MSSVARAFANDDDRNISLVGSVGRFPCQTFGTYDHSSSLIFHHSGKGASGAGKSGE